MEGFRDQRESIKSGFRRARDSVGRGSMFEQEVDAVADATYSALHTLETTE